MSWDIMGKDNWKQKDPCKCTDNAGGVGMLKAIRKGKRQHQWARLRKIPKNFRCILRTRG